MDSQVQGILPNLNRRTGLWIGLLFLTILAFHSYVHPLEAAGLYQDYLHCHWAQMAAFILEVLVLVFFTLLVACVRPTQLFLAISAPRFSLFSRDPPGFAF